MNFPTHFKTYITLKLLVVLILSLSAGGGPSRNTVAPCVGLRDTILNNHDDELLKLNLEERKSIALLEDEEVIHWAATCGYLKILQWINDVTEFDLRHLVHELDCFGDTPLHKAAFMGHIKVVRLLVSLNVDIAISNDYGYNAYNLALQEEHHEIAQLLRNAICLRNGDDSCLCLPRPSNRQSRVDLLEEVEVEDTFLLKALEVVDALSMYTWQQEVPEHHPNEKLLEEKTATRAKKLSTLMTFDNLEDKARKRAELKGLPVIAKMYFCYCANKYLKKFSKKWDICLPPMTNDERKMYFKRSKQRGKRFDELG